MQLEVERQALKKEKDEFSKNRIKEIDEKLTSLKAKEKDLREAWEHEKEINASINRKKEEIEKANRDLEYAESKYDLESAARLRHGVIPALEKELDELKTQ